MLEFRRNAESVLRRIAKGERFILSYRGKPVAQLEPTNSTLAGNADADPFLTIMRRAKPGPNERTMHPELDCICITTDTQSRPTALIRRFNCAPPCRIIKPSKSNASRVVLDILTFSNLPTRANWRI
jgi:antitoxin (DNA-binding transcriptional repressor) of toxin-antitoxin stability system